MKQTSILAYVEIIDDGTTATQKKIIYEYLVYNPDGKTRAELRDELGIMYTSIFGRVRSLVKSGKVYEDGKRMNKSNKIAEVIKAMGGSL